MIIDTKTVKLLMEYFQIVKAVIINNYNIMILMNIIIAVIITVYGHKNVAGDNFNNYNS